MDIGDSFFVPEGSQKKIACAASRAASRLGTKFITRRMKNGVRVWRAA
ncbi:hypothetical protein KGP36_07435 [Patescibacteria group bacterium]|nr:hypothetical protein [Patescibacteria group bacterium]